MVQPSFSPNALRILERRYLRRDANGRIAETPEQLLRRVAETVARAEIDLEPDPDVDAVASELYEEMARLRFLPNSPALGAGRPGAQLAACFVLPIEDDLSSIFETLKQTAVIHQSGGGTGFDFSALRPAGDQVSRSGGIASGPVSFLRLYDVATDVIKQGGVRRGANMGVLRVDHPDILAFVGEKAHPDRLCNFNLSVALTDAFMAAVEAGGYYDLVNPRDGRPSRRLMARKVWEAIVRHAWYSGEPGVLFLDRIEEANPAPRLGRIDATNPCGEQPLLPYESCTLGSINTSAFVHAGRIEWDDLASCARTAVRFLDDLIEAGAHPIEPIRRMTGLTRKIGLGLMGFADTLIALGIPYDDREALRTAGRLMAFVSRTARAESERLARSRGAFPAWEGSRPQAAGHPPRRNATVTTIAPTGTLSLLAGCSSGIEPLYAARFSRRVLGGQLLEQEQPMIRRIIESRGLDFDDVLERAEHVGSLQALTDLPHEVRRLFATATDVSFEWQVRMQAAFQEHTDNAVSKTINLPEDASVADVQSAYWLAYELGCKGITVYRQGSRQEQVLSRRGRQIAQDPGGATGACPDCGDPLPVDGRCRLCRSCGWSACDSTGNEDGS